MWVVLDPSLVADGAFPAVQVGQAAAVAFGLDDPVPSTGRPVLAIG